MHELKGQIRSRTLTQRKETALFRFKGTQPSRSVLVGKYCGINRLDGCCVDRLSRHGLSETWVPEPESYGLFQNFLSTAAHSSSSS